jgi:spoIIIJ-associated protein
MSNMDSTEAEAASVEDATRAALEQLGAREDEVTIEVIATPRAGVLGLGARNARVRVTRKGVAAGNVASATSSSPAPQSRTEGVPDGSGRGRENQRRGRNDGRARSASPLASAGDDDGGDAGRKSVGVEEQRREAIVILKQILEQMGEPTDVRQIEVDAETVELEIKGDGSGILIGRHGQTLDALEYIVNRILARRIKDAAPISLETESYRARRRQQLHRMALSMGEKAKREHKPVRLEPMPPRDRRVVHLALKDDPMITTRSAGDGTMRSIEIVPTDSGGRREPRGEGQHRGRRREPEREPQGEREREVQRIEPERGNEAIGEQGGFKHGQKRIV